MSLTKKLLSIAKYLKFIKRGGVVNLNITPVQYPSIYEGKRVLVTGGSEGIGYAIAKKFIDHGATVVITGRNLQKLKKAQESIGTERLKSMQWDISKIDGIKLNLEQAYGLMGGIDILVNNAAYLTHCPELVDESYFDMTLDTNLKAVYFMCQYGIEMMIAQNGEKGGKVLNISSINSFQSSVHPYYISKRGVNAITEGFAKKYGHRNINVNGIAPGYVASSINKQDVSENAYDSRSVNHRIITPEDISELAFFLCSDAASGIMGQTIVCDGGTLLK